MVLKTFKVLSWANRECRQHIRRSVRFQIKGYVKLRNKILVAVGTYLRKATYGLSATLRLRFLL